MSVFAYINPNAASDCAAAFEDFAAIAVPSPSRQRNKRDALLAETRDAEAEFVAEYGVGSRGYALDALKEVDGLATEWLAFRKQAVERFSNLYAFDRGHADAQWLDNAEEAVAAGLSPKLGRVFWAYLAERR